MLFNKSTRAIVTRGSWGRKKNPAAAGSPEENGTQEAPSWWSQWGYWVRQGLSILCVLLVLALMVLLTLGRSQGVTMPHGTSAVAVLADAALTVQAQPGDIAQVYGMNGTILPELRYVLIYQAAPEGLLVALTPEQTQVLLAQEHYTITLAIQGNPEEAAAALDLQERILHPQITLTVPGAAFLTPGEVLELEYTAGIQPEEAVLPEVAWQSNDPAIVTAENGVLTAQGVGEAVVTASCGGVEARCHITVAIPLEAISLDKESLTLAAGETALLTAAANPTDATGFAVKWRSADPAVATVDADGAVTAKATGATVITAVCGSVEASCTVQVGVHAEVAQLDKTALPLTVGQTERLAATVYPGSDVVDPVVWESADPAIATVEADGSVTGIAAGSTTITFRCGQALATCAVTVTAAPVR